MAIRTTSARIAITMATGNGWRAQDWDELLKLGCRIDRSGSGSNVPGMLHALDCGRVLAALDTCGEPAKDWAMLAYAAPGAIDDQCPFRVHERLMIVYLLMQDRTPKQTEKIGRLAWVSMHDMRQRQLHHERAMQPGDVAKKVGFAPNNWDTWKPKMEQMQMVIDEWDKHALDRVARVLFARQAA